MIKKLIRHGNSSLLNISSDTEFEITTDGRNLILSPQMDTDGESDILRSLEKINSRYGNALHRLGE